MRGDAETSGSDLLDGAPFGIAVRKLDVAGFVFPALARVGTSADAVHRNGKRLVSFGADRAERHGPGCESLYDFGSRLYFVNRNRAPNGFQFHQAAQSTQALILLID